MIVKAFVATALVAAPLVASDDVAYVQYPQVAQVLCDQGRGSAVKTTEGWLSVAHVTSLTNCTINGWPITAIVPDRGMDFSRVVTLAQAGEGVRINCEGFKVGGYYWSTGYALGKPYQTNVRLRATGLNHIYTGHAVLLGYHTVIPGMSGGASFSRALKDTALCSH